MDEKERYLQLFSELEVLEEKGIKIGIEGRCASPQQIVTAHMIQENGTYMRDYIMNEEGNIDEVDFINLM